MNRITALTAMLLVGLATSNALANEQIHVPDDYPTVAAAINAASNGDVITIAAGTHYEHSIDPNGKAITIQGEINSDGSLGTTIDAQGNGSVFQIVSEETNDTVIRYLKITGGSGYVAEVFRVGGGMFIGLASPYIIGCEITGNNVDGTGGGIAIYDANPRIIDCTISGNTGSTGGGIFMFDANVEMSSTIICGNSPDQTHVDESTLTGGNNTIMDDCPGLTGDLNNDGTVDIDDIRVLQQAAGICPSDINGDGKTDIEDLLNVIEGWGTTCP